MQLPHMKTWLSSLCVQNGGLSEPGSHVNESAGLMWSIFLYCCETLCMLDWQSLFNGSYFSNQNVIIKEASWVPLYDVVTVARSLSDRRVIAPTNSIPVSCLPALSLNKWIPKWYLQWFPVQQTIYKSETMKIS